MVFQKTKAQIRHQMRLPNRTERSTTQRSEAEIDLGASDCPPRRYLSTQPNAAPMTTAGHVSRDHERRHPNDYRLLSEPLDARASGRSEARPFSWCPRVNAERWAVPAALEMSGRSSFSPPT